MKKIAADFIETEMYRLLKKAQDDSAGALHADNAHDNSDMADDEDMAHDEDMSDDEDMADDLHSYLMDSVDDNSEDEVSYMDDDIHSMRNMTEDDLMREDDQVDEEEDGMFAKASDMRLMSGLGRIESSLRNKGEGFAADLVRATASSIKQDIVKEAAQRNYVVKNLVKMASDLDRKGDRAAARMVKSTIMKINR
jgi:hypothetical protein